MGFQIEVMPGGRCDIRLDGRAYRYDRDDLDEALTEVRRAGADSVEVIEEDGYRRTIRL